MPAITCRVAVSILTFVIAAPCGFAATGEDPGYPSVAGKSADQVAKELSNPAGSLASLSNNLVYQTYKGDLSNADDQDAWSYQFQPVLPFPVGDEGRAGPELFGGILRKWGLVGVLINHQWNLGGGDDGPGSNDQAFSTTWKFELQAQYFAEQPDTFGGDWQYKLTVTPVIHNPFVT